MPYKSLLCSCIIITMHGPLMIAARNSDTRACARGSFFSSSSSSSSHFQSLFYPARRVVRCTRWIRSELLARLSLNLKTSYLRELVTRARRRKKCQFGKRPANTVTRPWPRRCRPRHRLQWTFSFIAAALPEESAIMVRCTRELYIHVKERKRRDIISTRIYSSAAMRIEKNNMHIHLRLARAISLERKTDGAARRDWKKKKENHAPIDRE
ncbi:unnamed protein product [Trichogramma brassicae]|uniref:Secreted protein n=1 Tax=Trichogramma brassicae TaxID=86971 RepID=A0A6H5IRV0_9HYME|nr:unnamed protein product [Trichogramma brassicae]